jgi:hypothetical protein
MDQNRPTTVASPARWVVASPARWVFDLQVLEVAAFLAGVLMVFWS